jgi:hypothetical protein
MMSRCNVLAMSSHAPVARSGVWRAVFVSGGIGLNSIFGDFEENMESEFLSKDVLLCTQAGYDATGMPTTVAVLAVPKGVSIVPAK